MVEILYNGDYCEILTQRFSAMIVNKLRSYGNDSKYVPEQKMWRINKNRAEEFLKYIHMHSDHFDFIVTEN